jgi:hypothetical protein
MNSASWSQSISDRTSLRFEHKTTRRADIMREHLRFLCQECGGEMRRAKNYEEETGLIELACHHKRPVNLAALRRGK